jgi:hypothetical protein
MPHCEYRIKKKLASLPSASPGHSANIFFKKIFAERLPYSALGKEITKKN